MNPEVFAEWLRRQGHHIVRTASSYWYNQGPRVYQSFPYHWVIQPSEDELVHFLREHKAIALRYSTPIDTMYGKLSYHVVFEKAPYDLELLSSNARSTIRRGLRRCQIENISMERLAQEGWKLQSDTIERQERVGSLSQTLWQQICLGAKDLSGFEAWGALVDGELAASILTTCIEGTCYMLYPQSHRQYFGSYVNNALSYTVSRELLSRPNTKAIFYGLHSLDAPVSVDEFKFRMGYTAKPVRQRVVFHPWLTPLFNKATYGLVRQLLRLRPGNPMLAKAEGMFRFYLEGQRPLNQQTWPEVLVQPKSEESDA